MFYRFLAHIMLNSEKSKYSCLFYLFLQTLELLIIYNPFSKQKTCASILLLGIQNRMYLIITLLALSLVNAILFFLRFYIYRKSSYQDHKYQNQFFKIIIAIQVQFQYLIKTVLLIPLNYIIWDSLKNSENIIQISLVIILLVSYVLTCLPLITINYFNKFIFKKYLTTFPYFFNNQTFTFLYFHVFIIILVFQPSTLLYFNCLYFIIQLVLIYYHSPIYFRNNNLYSFFQFFILSSIFLTSINSLVQQNALTWQYLPAYLLQLICLTAILHIFQNKIIKFHLFKNLNSKNSIQNKNQISCCFTFLNQTLLYYMINFSQNQQIILTYFLNIDYTIQNKRDIKKQMLDILKQNDDQNKKKEKIFRLLRLFIEDVVINNNQLKLIKTLGKQQMKQKLEERRKQKVLMIQFAMMRDQKITNAIKLRNSYLFLKELEYTYEISLINENYLTKIELNGILSIIKQELRQKIKSQKANKGMDLKAQEYLEFEQIFENIKISMNSVSSNIINFWKQLQQSQVNNKTLENLIRSILIQSKRIQFLYKKIIQNYPKSSLIIYDLFFSYSQFVINSSISSVLNPFSKILLQYKHLLQKSKLSQDVGLNTFFDISFQLPLCVINADPVHKGSIIWSNSYFKKLITNNSLQNFSQNNQNYMQTKSKNTLNIQDIIIPFQRSLHQQYFDKFCRGDQLNINHQSQFIYTKPYIQISNIFIQIIPQFKQGLRFAAFFTKSKSKSNQSIFYFILNQNLQFIAFSKALAEKLKKSNQSQDISSNVQQFKDKLIKTISHVKSQQNDFALQQDLIFKHENVIYQIRLVKTFKDFQDKIHNFFQLSSKIRNRQYNFQFKNSEHLEVNNLIQHFIQDQEQPKSKKSSLKQKKKQIQSSYQIEIVKQKKENQKILQISYQILAKPKTPSKITIWRLITIFMISLMMILMILNIVITFKRDIVYEKDMSLIKNYNELIQYTVRASISIKSYNYHAFQNSSSQILLSYPPQINKYKTQISNLLNKLHDQLNQIWMAYQFTNAGKMFMKKERDTVVLSNYILSSLTFLEQTSPEAMSFPFLGNQFFWFFGMTDTEQNFLNFIFNSYFVALKNMLQTRKHLTSRVQQQIILIINQMYIFTSLGGLLILTGFIVFSLYIELKLKRIISEVTKLFDIYGIQDKKRLINRIERFKKQFMLEQKNEFKFNNLDKMKKRVSKLSPIGIKYEGFRQDPRVVLIFDKQKKVKESKQNYMGKARQVEAANDKENVHQVTKWKLQNLEQNLSQRYFKQQIQHNQIEKHSQKQQIQTSTVRQNFNQSLQSHKRQRSLRQQKKKKLFQTKCCALRSSPSTFFKSKLSSVIIFYLLIILPFSSYFIGIFFAGYNLNQKIMFYINFSSELYHISTHQQYNYAFTWETILYTGGFDNQLVSWGVFFLSYFTSVYQSVHYLEKNEQQIPDSSRYRQIKNTLDSNNLCDYLHLFKQKSIYYDIDFSKQQCQTVSEGILKKGLKQSFIYFTQKGIELLSRNLRPQLLDRSKRVQYFDGAELRSMKVVLSYCEQFNLIIQKAFEQDVKELKEYYIKVVNYLTSVSICGLVLIFWSINYRWKKMKSDSQNIECMLRIISLNEIKERPELESKFSKIDYRFYE